MPSLVVEHLDLFACPKCGGSLTVHDPDRLVCSQCGTSFGSENGIPELFWSNEWDRGRPDVTESIRAFYEENPFPNYEDIDSNESLRDKAREGIFARLLDEQIPPGATVLEVGCGTGQLSNFLSTTWGRTVFGCDLSLSSLRLAEEFRARNRNESVAFLHMNLFRPAFKAKSFDLVISNGVLHHTSDPFLAFRTISRLVKTGGHCIIGLYNRYGRIPTDLRRFVFRLTQGRLQFLDPRLRRADVGDRRKHTWFMDQYRNPHESKHTIGEVLRWFDETGFEFVNGIPKPLAFAKMTPEEPLFEKNPRGTGLDHTLVELGGLLSGGREGGFFVMIGRQMS